MPQKKKKNAPSSPRACTFRLRGADLGLPSCRLWPLKPHSRSSQRSQSSQRGTDCLNRKADPGASQPSVYE